MKPNLSLNKSVRPNLKAHHNLQLVFRLGKLVTTDLDYLINSSNSVRKSFNSFLTATFSNSDSDKQNRQSIDKKLIQKLAYDSTYRQANRHEPTYESTDKQPTYELGSAKRRVRFDLQMNDSSMTNKSMSNNCGIAI